MLSRKFVTIKCRGENSRGKEQEKTQKNGDDYYNEINAKQVCICVFVCVFVLENFERTLKQKNAK